jgi:hypothetical protein
LKKHASLLDQLQVKLTSTCLADAKDTGAGPDGGDDHQLE